MTLGPVDPTIFASIFAWVWATYSEKIANKVTKEVWEKIEWQLAANEYSDKVRRLYSTTRMLGKPDPVPLEGIYTDVHTLSRPTALRRFTIEQLEEEYTNKESRLRFDERRRGLAIVQQREKLFILGKPGAGKTTFCKHITLQAINGQVEKIPIFVSLNELADSGMNVMQFIVTQFDICNFPDAQPFVEQLLKAGKAIVLLDGLDEVQQADNKQDAVVMDIKDFVNKYDTSQYLITCRIAATDFTFEQFTYVEMADFTPSQVQTFVAKWFGESTDRGQAFLEEFQRPDHEGLREMAQTPLLLTLLCLTFEETLSFPQRRVEIYEEAIDALLKKWDSSRNIRRDDIYHKLSLGRKRQMLARIAAATFEEGQYFIPQQVLIRQIEDYLRRLPPADADEDIDGEAVLKAIEAQHGIFVERARRIYSFAHLTFQEYFTARYIADNAAGGTLARLVNDHLTNPRWREVFLLVASMLDDADDLFGLMIERVNDFAASSDVLMTTLQLVEDRVKTIQAYPDAVLVRASALAQALDTTKDINDNINLALDLEFALVLAVDHAHTFPMDLVENNHMARYLIAMQLIVDCLELAYVANRAAIEGRLLLPPQQPSS